MKTTLNLATGAMRVRGGTHTPLRDTASAAVEPRGPADMGMDGVSGGSATVLVAGTTLTMTSSQRPPNGNGLSIEFYDLKF